MQRTLWCRYPACGHQEPLVAGFMPPTCPGCGRDAKWATGPGHTLAWHYKGPRSQYTLNAHDRKLLSQLRIKD